MLLSTMKKILAIGLVYLLGSALGAQEVTSTDGADGPETASFRLARETLLAVLAKKQIRRDVGVFLNRFNEMEEMIGDRRRQELQVALFHLQREEFGLSLQDDPIALAQTADIVRSCVFKILREEIENTMPFELALGRLEKHRERLTPNVGGAGSSLRLRISPRFGVGDNSYVGAKFQLRGSDGLLDRLSLRLSQSVNENRNVFGVQYQDGPWDVELQHSFDAERDGHSVGLFGRYRFSN
jgi:hypothetical protein